MNPGGRGESDLERRLERELARSVRSLRAPSPSPAQAAYRRIADRARSRSLLAALGAASAKLGVGVVAAGLVATGGVVAATGSSNPTVWGTTVTRAVATCRGSLPSGQHGIGPCTTSVAQPKTSQGGTGQAAPSLVPSASPSSVPTVLPTPAMAGGPPSSDPRNHDAGQPTGQPTTWQPADGGQGQGGPAEMPAGGTWHGTSKPGGMTASSSSDGGSSTAREGGQTGSRAGKSGQHTGGPKASQTPTPPPPRAH